MKKKITILILTLIIAVSVCGKVLAKTEVRLTVDKTEIMPNEEFTVSVDMENAQVAAFNIWIYFDTEKVECLEKKDSINIVDNRIIYTWSSETGKNQNLGKVLDLKFKAKQEGSSLFSLVGEFYNQSGEKLNMEYNQLEVQIGKENSTEKGISNGTTQQAGTSGEQSTNENSSQSGALQGEAANQQADKSNANLDIMRLGQEGIVPDFSPEITEYYLVVEENIKSLDVTAVPQNSNANLKITGNKNLKNGLNTVTILVTSEDKTNQKEYTINVTRTNDVAGTNTDLEALAIENNTLVPEYQANVTGYSVEVSKDTDKLNVLAIPSDEEASVEITGNDELKTGDNRVEIKVTARNGITTKKYVVNVHRRTDEEEMAKANEQSEIINEANELLEQIEHNEEAENLEEKTESEESKQDGNVAISVIGSVLAVMTIGITVLRIVRSEKK